MFYGDQEHYDLFSLIKDLSILVYFHEFSSALIVRILADWQTMGEFQLPVTSVPLYPL